MGCRWRGKLWALAITVNAAGCVVRFHHVPREGVNEFHQYLGDASRAATANEVVDTAPARVWTANAGRGSVGAPAVGDRVTTLATVDRWVYALDTRTGRLFWRFHGNDPYTTGPVMANGRVFVATSTRDGELSALDLYSGKRKWRQTVGDVSSPISWADGTIYGATETGIVFAFDAATGRRRWARVVGPTRSGPLVLGSRLVLVTLTDSIYTMDAATGAIRARVALGTSTIAPLARIDDSTVAIASPDSAVLAVRIPSGQVVWRVAAGGAVPGSPAVARDTVFALTGTCTLWSIPAGDPARADSVGIGCLTRAGPAVTRRGVLVATVSGDLVYFDRAQRRRGWTRTVGGDLRQPPAVLNGQMIVAPIIGDVVSFR